MYYVTDAQTCAGTRQHEWEREVAALQLYESASGTPQGRAAAGTAMGKLLVDLFVSLRGMVLQRGPRTA